MRRLTYCFTFFSKQMSRTDYYFIVNYYAKINILQINQTNKAYVRMRRATSAMSTPGREKSASTTSRIPRAKPVGATNVKTKDGPTSRDRVLGGKSKSPAKSTSIPNAVDVGTSVSSVTRSPSSASQRAPKHRLQPRKDKKGSGSKENLPQGTSSCKHPTKRCGYPCRLLHS